MQDTSSTLEIARTLDVPFDELLGQVERALEQEGFGILTRIDVQATLKKKLDVDMPRYLILGACNPRLAHRAITSARHDAQATRVREALANVAAVVEQRLLQPTLRPTSTEALALPGLYVFRFFDVMARDIDEFVALSGRAWTTFETAADYRSHPEGLFRPLDAGSVRSTMLLCTWYDGFESWRRSRTPAPAARANFAARHALTLSTWAIATQLVSAGS